MTEDYEAPYCEVPGCKRPQAPGWRICRSDGRWCGDTLTRLRDRYSRLAAAPPIRSASAADGSGHGGTLASQRDPARMSVLAVTDWRSGAHERLPADPWGWDDTPSIFGILNRWAEEIRAARSIQPPKREIVIRYRYDRAAGPVCQQMRAALADQSLPCRHGSCRALVIVHEVWADLTVATERKLLADQLPWLLGTDWAADFHADLTTVWSLLGAPRRVGTCGQCGGPVTYANRQASCLCGTRAGLDLIEYTTGRTA